MLASHALAALDRIFAGAAADEPDVGHNIDYELAREKLLRITRSRPWTIPPADAEAIRWRVAEVFATHDPRRLDAHLSWFSGELFRHLARPGQVAMARRTFGLHAPVSGRRDRARTEEVGAA
jgi:hypothetical protein